jgi:hypothetical protein
VVMAVGLTVVVVQRIVGTSPANAFFYPGTIGVLSLLVAYIVTHLGAIRFLFIAARRAPIWQVVIPIIGDRLPRLHDLQERQGHLVPV